MTTRLLSVLGLGPKSGFPHYHPTVYVSPDGKGRSDATPLVQVALNSFYSPSSIHLLATDDVRDRWSARLPELLPGAELHEIPTGRDVDQQWKVFEVVVQQLDAAQDANEQVIVDVTHGFRSLPLVVVSAVNFARARWRMRSSTRAVGPDVTIVYGAYEAGGVDGAAPIWDLTGLLRAADWADALRAFLSFGRADDLAERVTNESAFMPHRELPKQQRGGLKTLGSLATTAADDLTTARVQGLLHESVPKLINAVRGDRLDWFRANRRELYATLEHFVTQLDPLTTRDRPDTKPGLLAAVELARLLGRMQRTSEQATVARETAVTFFGVRAGIPSAFGEEGKFVDGAARERADRELGRLQHLRDGSRESRLASELAQARNYIQHAGMNANNLTAKDLRDKVARCVEELGTLIAEWDGVVVGTAPPAARFINLSNHPVATWPTRQREAAAALGEVVDLDGGMPTVDPDLSIKEVEELAKQLAARALVQRPTAAGVFGEPVLTAQLVHRLEGQGIACFAPAGARQVLSEDLADGSVRVTRSFRFHQWRPYRTTRG